MKYALGRKPRSFNPDVPHMSALRMIKPKLPPVPKHIDYAEKLPQDLGMMGNDRLGDCTAAGCYHAEQVWTQCAQGSAVTGPDSDVIEWYSECTGYNPQTGANDDGANEQDVLTKWMAGGMPLKGGRDKLMAFVEIDPRNLRDVRRAIYECGVVYIGFEVPAGIPEEPGSTWDNPKGRIEGGHCVVLPGFRDWKSFEVISWGARYTMTYGFWERYVDEAYALIDPDWAQANGSTLLGLSLDELKNQMQTLRRRSLASAR